MDNHSGGRFSGMRRNGGHSISPGCLFRIYCRIPLALQSFLRRLCPMIFCEWKLSNNQHQSGLTSPVLSHYSKNPTIIDYRKLSSNIFLSTGHDLYWSRLERLETV
jgi:hypothetical protein